MSVSVCVCVCVCVMLVLCLLCVCVCALMATFSRGANMLATFEQLCAYYANGFLVDRVELGLDLTMSKTSTHTHIERTTHPHS